jgi:hypothetical protein
MASWIFLRRPANAPVRIEVKLNRLLKQIPQPDSSENSRMVNKALGLPEDYPLDVGTNTPKEL